MSKARFERMMRVSKLMRHVAITVSISYAALAEAIRIVHL